MKKIILFVLLALSASWVFAQSGQKYTALVNEAWNLYENGEYLKSAQKYSEAFAVLGNEGFVADRYNAACSWALAKEADSAFVQLYSAAQKGNYADFHHIINDNDLKFLHADIRWNKIVLIVKSNQENPKLDKFLVAMLDSIHEDDQNYRMQDEEIEKKYGWKSEEMKNLWKIINIKDSLNLIKVSKILDERGWLGADIVGAQGNSTLFLVIQHSDLETQKKYLPMMRDAVAKGNAKASSLALLEDRVALEEGKKQLYGSQVGGDSETGFFVYPIEDPDNVDKRRAEVGLGKLQDYLRRWGIVWDIEEHKKQAQEAETNKEK